MARKILLADDSVTAQSMGRRILSEAGYEVVTVNNGSAALKKIAEQAPDILILDVYMPGYGGLEVCQRLKAAEETARIPVLLTVGKLEPFKAEEARRVRADAYLIKPFEASELLAALVKLEDKIVPGGQTRGTGSFAKALAAMEEQTPSIGRKKGFGSADTGWKDRLSIPGTLKRREDPPSSEQGAHPFRDFSREDHPAAAATADTAPGTQVPDGVLRDITAEEIAAITAAAAAFGGRSEGETPGVQTAPVAQEQNAASESTEPASAETASAETAAPVAESSPAEPVALSAAASETVASPDAAPQELPAYAAAVSGAPAPEESPVVYEPPAIQDFPAADTDGVIAAMWRDAESSVEHPQPEPEAEPVPAGVHAEAAITSAAAEPRWIAEEVALSEEDSVDLEREMQKARAAMEDQAAEAARATEPAVEELAPVESPAPAIEEIPVAASTFEAPQAVEEIAAPVEELQPAPVEAVENPAEETVAEAIEMEAPAETVEAVSAPVAEAVVESVATQESREATVTEAVASETVSPAQSDEGSLAAAAAAGFGNAGTVAPAASFSEAPVVEAETVSPAGEAQPSIPEQREHQREAELAQAWAQWRQIRDSLASPHMASQLAEVAATGLQNSDAQAANRSQEVASSGGPDAIASIVDSVLSELKPKIVEEIAKKLGQKK